MTCVICGSEIREDQEHTPGRENVSHGYCYDVNFNFQKEHNSAMHYRNIKTNKVVVPEIDSEGYVTGRYQTLSESAVESKIKKQEAKMADWRKRNNK